ncbi:hypothetical protein HG536_0C05330 [Torulaspora globosa]|uniref:Uncharacterized protein n=1 Tax=Torulaspora globosa TaxID=48254 RepID=A0A7G3ZFS8_9SACH|nr:uncharacterized protein HG536_0C05330 [Torulaspora globosa]QLL32364.1 hypothetical protein HG536_0C05330 [Torulaspora globosa]
MAGTITFTVSTPCNAKGKPSGYRLVQYADGGLSVISHLKDHNMADIDINVQAFCYLKPRSRAVVPDCVNDGLVDSSDYMVLAKSSGFIEIIKDFQFKSQQGLPLNPSFVLRCSPEDNVDLRCDSMVAGLQYKEGLLYCCLCSGKIYVYVLNLPHDYIQAENSFVISQPAELFYSGSTCPDLSGGRDTRSLEEATFYVNMKYTGRSRLKHICYYLLPMEPNHLRVSPAIFLFGHCYKDVVIFKPSIFVELDQGVTTFRINPLDRFSFFTASPRSALMIRKIMLPMAYVDFFIAFTTKKKIVQEAIPEEIKSWNMIAQENGYNSLVNWILEEPIHDLSNLATIFWEDLARYDGISIQRTITVWIQKQAHVKDDIFKLFRHGSSPYDNDFSRRNSAETPVSNAPRRLTRHGFDRNVLRSHIDLPHVMDWELGSFVRDLGRNSFMADFQVIQSNTDSNGGEHDDREEEDGETRTSFLTDSYKDMDVVCIDRYSTLTVFRPRQLDLAVKRVDFLQYCMRYSGESSMRGEEALLQRVLSTFTCLKKLFMLTESLCMALDTNGVLLINRHQLSEANITEQVTGQAVKVAPFNIGLISDAVLIVNKLDKKGNGSFEIAYNLLVTCIPAQILALEGTFVPGSRVGEIILRDSLKLKRKDRFVDRICLVSYEPSRRDRKRSFDLSGPSITKRTKWE